MKIVFILCLVTAAFAAEKETKAVECDGVQVHGKFHRKEVLARGLNRPYQLALLKQEHKIFFSYNVGEDEDDTFRIGYIEKNHTTHKELSEVENGFAIAIDNDEAVAYFGGSTGIYKYHANNKEKPVDKILSDHNIWDMFFSKELYFISYPKQHLFKLTVEKKGHHFTRRVDHIHEAIYQVAIDKDNDTFITNETGLYRIKEGSSDRIKYEGDTVFRAIELDNKGEAYFCGKHAIYKADKTKHVLDEVARIKNIFGLAFDHDNNIIYSDPHEIVRLLPENCKK